MPKQTTMNDYMAEKSPLDSTGWPAHEITGYLTASQVANAFGSIHRFLGLPVPGDFYYGKTAVLTPYRQRVWIEGCRMEDSKQMALVEKGWSQYKREYKGDEELVDLMNYEILWEEIQEGEVKKTWSAEEQLEDRLRMAAAVREDGAKSVTVPGGEAENKDTKPKIMLSAWNTQGLIAFAAFIRSFHKDSVTAKFLHENGPAYMLSPERHQQAVTKYYDNLTRTKKDRVDAKFKLFRGSLRRGELMDKNVFIVWWETVEEEMQKMDEAKKQGGDIEHVKLKWAAKLAVPLAIKPDVPEGPMKDLLMEILLQAFTNRKCWSKSTENQDTDVHPETEQEDAQEEKKKKPRGTKGGKKHRAKAKKEEEDSVEDHVIT